MEFTTCLVYGQYTDKFKAQTAMGLTYSSLTDYKL